MATDEQIATAFNAGYTMQQIDPAMIEKLLATDNKDNEIVQAMVQGAKKSKMEKIVREQSRIKSCRQKLPPGSFGVDLFSRSDIFDLQHLHSRFF